MRILSLHPVATEALFALGAGNMLVGRCDACDYPEAARSVPSIGNAAEVTQETAAIFEPGLILLGPGQEAIAQTLRFPTLRFAPTSVEDLARCLTALGNTLGKNIEADMLVQEITTFAERVKARTGKFHPVRVHLEQERPLALPQFLHTLIALAGGEAYAGAPTIEGIAAFNPHLIIFVGTNDRYEELLRSRDGWKKLQAITHERLFIVDDGVLRPTPRVTQGLQSLAKILHGVEIN